jgi:hypothetical protein
VANAAETSPSSTPPAPAASESATVSNAAPEEKKPLPIHGTQITYGPSATAYTFDQGAELHYNPTVGHRLGILPEYHFNDLFFARAKFWLSQELTQSDTTTYKNEVELSDLWLDFGTEGFTESHTGIKLSGEVRVTLPTSKTSQSIGRIMTVGPLASVSKKFDVLKGLTFGYVGRFTYRFNQFTTGQYQTPYLASCGDPRGATCADFYSSGLRSVNYDVTHGLVASFMPHEKVSLDVVLWLQHAWLYPLAPAQSQFLGSQGLTNTGTNVRNTTVFYLSGSYQLTKVFGLTLGAFTFTGEPTTDGNYLNPFFNRYTTLYLEAGVDVEAVAASLL